MVRKKFKMEELDCAHCAAKMEERIGKIDGVESCNMSFMTQKLTIEADEDKLDEILAKAQEEVTKIDSQTRIIV